MAWRSLWGAVQELAGWLGWGVGIYFALLVAWTLSRKSRPKHAVRWMRYVEKLNRSKKSMSGWAKANELPLALIFALLIMSTLIWATIANRYPIAIYHDVVIHPQNEYGDWPMSAREDAALIFRPCPDFDVKPMLKKAVEGGWIAAEVKWEQQPTCQSIYAAQLGFKFNYSDFSYRRVSDARSAAK